MSRPPSPHPTELELEILKILWRDGDCTVRQVREALAPARTLAHTSVITTMNIMVDKGYLARDAEAASHVYRARVAAQSVRRRMLSDLVRRAFDGSAGALMLNLIDSAELKEDEIKELRQRLNKKNVARASRTCGHEQKEAAEGKENSAHVRDARATESGAMGGKHVLSIRQGAYLPHWTMEGASYFVTFRLADSLPNHVVKIWEDERLQIIQRAEQQKRSLTASDMEELDRLFFKKIDQHLDMGSGSCALREGAIAEIVRNAMLFFDSGRYALYAWVIMPNHVHAVLQPRAGCELDEILYSWKAFTGKEINKTLGRSGPFWQAESYDHLIRTGDELVRCASYTFDNPEKAGFQNWQWRWMVGLDEILPCAEREGIVYPGVLSEREVTVVRHVQDAHATEEGKHARDGHRTNKK